MKAALILTARNKERHVARAVRSAIEQTYPCEVLVSYQSSDDNTLAEIEKALEQSSSNRNRVRILHCPLELPYCMKSLNEHFRWAVSQTDADFVFQTSVDDYDLPDRVRVCMQAFEAYEPSVVACAMYFEDESGNRIGRTNYPKSGFVDADEALKRLLFGSSISGYSRRFLDKVGSAGPNTMDVYYGFLGALDRGFYYVDDAQHVHTLVCDRNNCGFQGKLRAVSEGTDEHAVLSEANLFQMSRLYFSIAEMASRLYPGANPKFLGALYEACLQTSYAWIKARQLLLDRGIEPSNIQ